MVSLLNLAHCHSNNEKRRRSPEKRRTRSRRSRRASRQQTRSALFKTPKPTTTVVSGRLTSQNELANVRIAAANDKRRPRWPLQPTIKMQPRTLSLESRRLRLPRRHLAMHHKDHLSRSMFKEVMLTPRTRRTKPRTRTRRASRRP